MTKYLPFQSKPLVNLLRFSQLFRNLITGFQAGPTFLLFLLFPTFLICSYFSLLFHENALLSLLFHSKMLFTHKNPEIFPRSLRSLEFYMLVNVFSMGHAAKHLHFLFYYPISISVQLVLLSHQLLCLFSVKFLIFKTP